MHLRKFIVLAATLVMLCSGCTSTATKRLLAFEETKVASIHKGMPVSEVQLLFGVPDVTYKATIGENTAEPWPGLVYEYHTVKDTTYKFETRYLTNTFIFWTGNEPPTLNSWIIEYTHQ